MLDGYSLEIVLTAANSAAQAWYGYDQVGFSFIWDIALLGADPVGYI